MKAYSYDNEGRYIGAYTCQRDPVRSAREGDEVYLLPASATFTAPPAYDESAEIPVWDGTAWTVQALPEPPEPEPAPEPAPEPEEAVTVTELAAAIREGVDEI